MRGETVTYVNCTPRQSWLEERLGLEVPSGWTDVLSGSASLEDAIIATDVQHLSVLGAGSLLSRYNSDINSAAMRELLSQVAAKAKFVIIELPSQDDVPAIAAVFAAVDGVQAVARIKKSSRSRVQLLLEQVEDAGAELSGVWLQRRRD